MPVVIKIYVLSTFEWQFYTGFTVKNCIILQEITSNHNVLVISPSILDSILKVPLKFRCNPIRKCSEFALMRLNTRFIQRALTP